MARSGNSSIVPEAREALNRFKMEAANEVGVNLKQGYNGDLTSREAGSVGGQMVKKMIQSYENGMKQGLPESAKWGSRALASASPDFFKKALITAPTSFPMRAR